MIDIRSTGLKLAFRINLICMVLPVILFGTFPAVATSTDDEIAALKAQKNDAIFKVQDIVNQPITHLKYTADMVDLGNYAGGWFHPGAVTPDFDHVDVRTTQQLVYDGHKYVTSPDNPGEVFLSSDLEFNPMTKYFYTDRFLPKMKLTEDEMVEINQLYRIIGQCTDRLADLTNPDPPLLRIQKWVIAHKPATVGILAGLLVVLMLVRRLRKPQFEN
jgi:hypothetical protein